ncbi:MAG: hypothetical protein V1845_03605 [bacterium]
MEEPQNKSLQNLILEKIKSGKAKMRPRWHFILKAGLFVAGFVIATFALLYLTSFILFILRQTGVWFLPAFGWRGMGVFLISFPWLLILVGIIFVILLEIMVRHYSFAYRKPLLYSLAAIIAFVAVAGLIAAKTTFHERLFLRARQEKLPIAGPFYREFGMPRMENAHIGTIIEITNDGFLMEDLKGEKLTIIVSPETSFPLGIDFQKDDRVMILGERSGNSVKALGIRRIDEMMGNIKRQRLPRPGGWFMPMK